MRMTRQICGRGPLALWCAAMVCVAMLLPLRAAERAPASGGLSGPGATFTLHAPPHGWTLIAYGDMRFTDPANTEASNPRARRALIRRIAREKPDLLLLSGDVPYEGGNPRDWGVYRRETRLWRKERLRVFPALGNHEFYTKRWGERCVDACLENWWKAFPRLRHRRWYSVRYGSAYLITVDSDLALTPGSRQARWVAGQLAHLPPQVRYVFVSLHHPPVADPAVEEKYHSVRPNEAAFARELEAAAAKIGAKIIVICGHIHNYERFERNGVVYLVSGGGGAHPYPVVRSAEDLYQNSDFPNFHYIRVDCERGQLRATMFRLDEHGDFVAKDRFIIRAAPRSARSKSLRPMGRHRHAPAAGAR
jgi:hypothetical protein